MDHALLPPRAARVTPVVPAAQPATGAPATFWRTMDD
jgi:hypothetical protein